MAALLGLLLFLTGCGGGGDGSQPVATVTNAAVTTFPSPLTHAGGTATITATVNIPPGAAPPILTADVTDAVGASILSGPKTMTATSTPGVYTYQLSVPNNALGLSPKVYTATVTASTGGSTQAPVSAGAISVPPPAGPPPPPGP